MSETYLSKEAHARLLAELEELKTVGRERISAEIEEARAHGDLRENAEYHAAKDEQGKMEARIRQIETTLREAKVGAPPTTDTAVSGLVVELDVRGTTRTYLLGSREDSHSEYKVVSSDSPIGSAITGHKVGDTVTVEAPAMTYEVTITDIRPA